jgi:hypothetical protein
MLFGSKQKVGGNEKLAHSMTLERIDKSQISKSWEPSHFLIIHLISTEG